MLLRNSKSKVKKTKNKRAKDNKFRKLLSLSNIHAGLYLADNVMEYSITVINCNVLIEELKHKVFKEMTDAAAPSNLIKYLFARDVLKQSLGLGLVDV